MNTQNWVKKGIPLRLPTLTKIDANASRYTPNLQRPGVWDWECGESPNRVRGLVIVAVSGAVVDNRKLNTNS